MFREFGIVLPCFNEIYENIQLQGDAFVRKTSGPPINCETAFQKAVAQRALRSLQVVSSTWYLGLYFL